MHSNLSQELARARADELARRAAQQRLVTNLRRQGPASTVVARLRTLAARTRSRAQRVGTAAPSRLAGPERDPHKKLQTVRRGCVDPAGSAARPCNSGPNCR